MLRVINAAEQAQIVLWEFLSVFRCEADDSLTSSDAPVMSELNTSFVLTVEDCDNGVNVCVSAMSCGKNTLLITLSVNMVALPISARDMTLAERRYYAQQSPS